jgi:hypothetical protein
VNKQRIEDVDEALDRWHRRLTMCVNKINELRAKRRKMVTGRIKVPPHPGVKVMLTKPDFDDDISDLHDKPIAPGTNGPC